MSETTKTVSKTTGPVEAQEVQEVAPAKRKTITNWRVFEQGGLVPVRFRCEGYLGSHPNDMSCHTNLGISAENVLRHMNPDHGGGWFRVQFRLSDGKVSPIWRELEEAGVEIQEFYCPHCRQLVAMNPRTIIKHIQPHQGATRINPTPQCLCMTLSTQKPDVDEFDELYEAA
jgi:hypothetical protein